MSTPIRILRAQVETLIDLRATWRPAQFQRERLILRLATALIATHGLGNITLPALAQAMMMANATLKRYFVDLEALVGAILRRHLKALQTALAEIPADTPNLHATRRQTWLRLTRTDSGDFNDEHKIFVKFRHHLPADIRPALEALYQELGTELAAAFEPKQTLEILDSVLTTPANLEMILTAATPAPAGATQLRPAASRPAAIQPRPETLPNPAFLPRPAAVPPPRHRLAAPR